MVDLKRFSNMEVQKYRERVQEFSDPEARHCYACQKYIPGKFKDARGCLGCTCGAQTCFKCRRNPASCDCCSKCRLPLGTCQCCVKCRLPRSLCKCTTMTTDSAAVKATILSQFPNAKKCPKCPHAWEKISGCNHGQYPPFSSLKMC